MSYERVYGFILSLKKKNYKYKKIYKTSDVEGKIREQKKI